MLGKRNRKDWEMQTFLDYRERLNMYNKMPNYLKNEVKPMFLKKM